MFAEVDMINSKFFKTNEEKFGLSNSERNNYYFVQYPRRKAPLPCKLCVFLFVLEKSGMGPKSFDLVDT